MREIIPLQRDIWPLAASLLFRKSVSLFLALFLCMSFGASVFAEEAAHISPNIETTEASISTDTFIFTPNAETSFVSLTPTEPIEDGETTNFLTDQTNSPNDTLTSDPIPEETEEESISQEISLKTAVDPETGGIDSVPTVTTKEPSTKVLMEDGSFAYEYPFTVPPGRGKITPSLSLNYRSSARNDTDIAGYGWSFSIPYIQRINKTGVQNLYNEAGDNYYSSLSGELVRIGSTTEYRAKIEKGDFLKYTLSDNIWTVVDKDGTTYTFGSSTASRQDDPENAAHIYKWMLSQTEDVNGNRATYLYEKKEGAIYPSRISYTEWGTELGIFSIVFKRTATSPYLSYSSAFRVNRTDVISEVEIYTENNLTRKYLLRYGTGINEHRSVLRGITEKGVSSSTEVILPETSFTYGGSMLPEWSPDYSTFPEALSGQDGGVRFGDLNGDGLTDVVKYYRKADFDASNPEERFDITAKRVHLNKGDGQWDMNVPWDWDDIQVPFYYTADGLDGDRWTYNDLGTRLIDVNGDGKADIVAGFGAPTYYGNDLNERWPLGQLGVYLNMGTGFRRDPNWTGVQPIIGLHSSQQLNNIGTDLIDVNGDSLPDIVSSYRERVEPYPVYSRVSLNTGHGWELSTRTIPAPLGPIATRDGLHHFEDTGTRLADVNGDGLVDVVQGYDHGNEYLATRNVYLNTGNGWTASTTWGLPISFVNTSARFPSQMFHLIDINGDGLPEIVKAYEDRLDNHDIYLNTGSGWVHQPRRKVPFELNRGSTYENAGTVLVDFNGDTLVDSLNLGYIGRDATTTQVIGGWAFVSDTAIPNLLTKITYGTDATIEVAYDGYLDTTQQVMSLVGTVAGNPIVVSSITFNSGEGNTWTERYTYQGGSTFIHPENPFERKFAGFSAVTKTDDRSQTTTYYHQGNSTNTATSEPSDSEIKIGLPYRTDVEDLSGNVYTKTQTTWKETSLGSKSTFVFPEKTLTSHYDGDSTHKDTAITLAYDHNGNLIAQKEWGEVKGVPDGSWVDVGTDMRRTLFTYASSTDGRVRNARIRDILYDSHNVPRKHSRYIYDNLPFGLVSKGNMTRRDDLIASTTFASTVRTYNAYGLPTKKTDPRGNITTYAYDSRVLYPASTTNALGHKTSYEYDYSSGKIVLTKDANGAIYRRTYDALDRLTARYIPHPETGAEVIEALYTYVDTPRFISITEQKPLSSTTQATTITYKDSFGRVLQEKKSTENSGVYATRNFIYGQNGELAQESLPYFSNVLERLHPAQPQSLYTTYTKDPLGRVTRVENAVGNTYTRHDDWNEEVVDANDKKKAYGYDAHKRLSSVTEFIGTKPYITRYEWGADDTLQKITDAQGNIRTITYDALGRRLTISDLHAPEDTSFGSWSFVYDVSNNLITSINPKKEVVAYTYDKLNRRLTEDFTGAAGIEVVQSYDTCAKGIGLLCSVSNKVSTTTYEYRAGDVMARENRIIDKTTYTTAYAYDTQKNPIAITYPDGSQVHFTYNAGNLRESIVLKESGAATSTSLISNIDYAPTGLPTNEVRGNRTTTTRTYDPDKNYRLTNIKTTGIIAVPASTLEYTIADFRKSTLIGTTASGTQLSLAKATGTQIFGTTTLDYFSDAQGKALPLHIPNMGTSWKQEVGSSTIGIYNNQLRASTTSQNTGAIYTISPNQKTNAYSIEWQNVSTTTNATDASHLIGHFASSTSYYAVSFYGTQATKDVVLRKKVNGVVTNLGSSNVDIQNGDRFRFELATSSQKVFKNESLLLSAGDTTATLQGAGRAGVGFGSLLVATDDIGTSTAWDTFKISTSSPTYIYNPGSWVSEPLPIGSIRSASSTRIAFAPSIPPGTSVQVQVAMTLSQTSPPASAWKTATSGLSIPIIGPGNNLAGKYLWIKAVLTPSSDKKVTPSLASPQATLMGRAINQNQTVQDLRYTYDPAGNITAITSLEGTGTWSTVTYTYDDLHRLITASTTGNTEGNYKHTFAYSPIGNITSFPGNGAYQYQGATGTSFANPHAATSIGTTTFFYDLNGNIASSSDGVRNAWDYQNRLMSSAQGSSTVSYAYDHAGSRIKKQSAKGTTIYPSTLYEVRGSTTTKHIYQGDMLVASVEKGSTTPAKIFHTYLDHLGSTDLVIDQSGVISEDLEYYPFGTPLSDVGTYKESNQYTGHDYDPETNMNYMGARYYAGKSGRFASQDPVSLALGDWKTVQEKTGDQLGYYLKSPQTHNSYSYTANNPIRHQDKGGEYLESVVDVAFIAYDLYKVGQAVATGGDVKAELGYLGLDIAGLAMPAGTGFGLTGRIAAKGGDNLYHLQRAAKQNNWGRWDTLSQHLKDHGTDFGITDPAKYAKFGNDFKSKIGTNGVESFTDKEGVVRVYEESTNTFAVYNKNGTTATIFKPESKNYWSNKKKEHGIK